MRITERRLRNLIRSVIGESWSDQNKVKSDAGAIKYFMAKYKSALEEMIKVEPIYPASEPEGPVMWWEITYDDKKFAVMPEDGSVRTL
jgi:hypothetical protein